MSEHGDLRDFKFCWIQWQHCLIDLEHSNGTLHDNSFSQGRDSPCSVPTKLGSVNDPIRLLKTQKLRFVYCSTHKSMVISFIV